jgi:putative hydrolase
MSDEDPPGGDPFGGIPFIGELMKLMQGAGGPSTDTARHLARTLATGGESEPNVDPTARIEVEELMRVAELRIADATGLPIGHQGAVRVEVGNRTQWADRTIDDYRPLFEKLSASMAAGLSVPDDLPDDDPMASMMAGIGKMMGPLMLGMTTGSMVGHLAQRALGGYELPVPRPAGRPLLVLIRNVDEFADSWSLDRSDLRLWICLHEAAYEAVFSVPHVRARLEDLLSRHASAFDSDPRALEEKLGGFDLGAGPESLAELQATLGDPDVILGAVRSPAQAALQPELTALVATVTGYVDHVMDDIGTSLIGSYPMLTEALRRRRVEADVSNRFVERILGLELDRAHYERAMAFVDGIVERAGSEALSLLLSDIGHLPTPNEVDAPGLWLARIELTDET